MKRLLFFLFVNFVVVGILAQPATGYYNSADNKKGTSLLQALSDIIDNHTVISYDNLEDYYPDIDARIDDPNRVWDIYSTCEFSFNDANCSQKQVCDCWNKEHTVPQSWFSGTSGMKSDLFHVLPTDARVNNFRGNLPYGEVSDHSSPVCDDSRALGWRSGSVFEPIDEFKGDIARIYFYVATRYDENCTNWSGGMFGSGNNGFKSSVAAMLLKWHRNDPVSEKELLRNNAVAKVQKNRNPFVDFPCLAEYIWGEYNGQSVDFSKLISAYSDEYASSTDKSGCECASNTSITITPSGTVYFETYDATATLEDDILIKGTDLASGVTLTLSGSNKFSLDKTLLTANEVNAGANVQVTYLPTELGRDTAKLIVASGSISTTTYLVGECLFEALEATDLTQNSFVANWTNAGTESYSLDVYTREAGGTAEVVLLQDECNKATTATTSGGVYYDINDCVRLGSGSQTGSLTYSNLDLSKGGKVIVNAQYYSNDSGTEMKITVGDVSETFALTSAFVDYVLQIPANAANASVDLVIESLVKKKRVNVNNVQVVTGGETVGKVSVAGYPKTVGNVQSYWVNGVNCAVADYYYTVTPQNSAVSNEILVKAESENTDIEEILAFDMRNYLIGNCWIIEDVAPESVLTLMTTSGVILERTVALQSNVQFALPTHGVYLVRIETNGNPIVLKTVY